MTPARMGNGNYTRIKKIVVGLSGVAMLLTSIQLSRVGVGFEGDAAWIGLVIAVSLTCAEFMFDSNFDEMNWTILILGLGAYIYSIITNINGFYDYQNISGTIWTNPDTKSILGGIFMDVYPEIAIAWALNESKVGDLIGNAIKSWKDPEKMTEQNHQNGRQGSQSSNQSSQPSQPSNQQYRQPQTNQSSNQQSRNSQQAQQQKPTMTSNNQQRPIPRFVISSQGNNRPEPTYHPILYASVKEDDKEKKDNRYDA